jgi:hypothetical protein
MIYRQLAFYYRFKNSNFGSVAGGFVARGHSSLIGLRKAMVPSGRGNVQWRAMNESMICRRWLIVRVARRGEINWVGTVIPGLRTP